MRPRLFREFTYQRLFLCWWNIYFEDVLGVIGFARPIWPNRIVVDAMRKFVKATAKGSRGISRASSSAALGK
jgi:hypothetical protein